jgi:hypothetical protein
MIFFSIIYLLIFIKQFLLIYYINFKRISLLALLIKLSFYYKKYFLINKLLKLKKRKIIYIKNF